MASYLGLAAALMASLTWAVGVMVFTPLSKRHPAYIINLHRILLALPVFVLLLVLRGDFSSSVLSLEPAQWGWATLAVVASYAFGDVMFLMAAKRLGGPAALAIASTYPVFSALGALVFRGETLPSAKYFGILIVIVGTIFVILSGARQDATLAPNVQDAVRPRSRWRHDHAGGVLLAFTCALFWALNTVAVAQMGTDLDAVVVNAVRLAIALVLCPLVGIGMHGLRSFKLIPRREFLPLLPIFAIEAIAGPFFYVYGLSHSPLAIGAALTSLAPVLSVPLALMLGHEKFSWPRSLGVTAVVAGIWVMVF